MEKEHGNRIFEVKESVIGLCQKCKKDFNNPSLAYYVEDEKILMCVECAKKYKNKELRIFIDMDDEAHTKVLKGFMKSSF